MNNEKKQIKKTQRLNSLEKIITAARKIFVNSGFFGASMSQIAKEAKLNQALIYHYFSSKEELWKVVKKDALDKSFNTNIEYDIKTLELKDWLNIIIKNRFNFYKQNPDLRIIVTWEKIQAQKINLYGIDKNFDGIFTKDIKELQNRNIIDNNTPAEIIDTLIISTLDGGLDIIPYMYKNDISIFQKQYLELVENFLFIVLNKNYLK